MKQIVNGIEVDLTPEEEAEYNQRQAEWEAGAPARIIAQFTQVLEKIIDDKAAERTYSSAVSCASYKDSTNPQWAAEATVFIAWRDATYAYGLNYLAEAQQGHIEPDLEEFIAGIPTMEWPPSE